MGRQRTTIVNPSLGVKYIVFDTQTQHGVVGKVLGLTEAYKINGPIRSSKHTPAGEEFFYMEIEGKFYKFLNSNKFPDCRSEDGRFLFLNKKPFNPNPRGRKKKEHSVQFVSLETQEQNKHNEKIKNTLQWFSEETQQILNT